MYNETSISRIQILSRSWEKLNQLILLGISVVFDVMNQDELLLYLKRIFVGFYLEKLQWNKKHDYF